MKKEFYKRVKKELPSRSFPAFAAAFALVFLTGMVLTILAAAGKFLPEPVAFDKNGEQELYSQLNVLRVTGSFAGFTDENGNAADYGLYFVVNEKDTYVVALNGDDFEALSDVYRYTVTGGGEEPAAKTLTGISYAITDEMANAAIPALRANFGIEDSVSDEAVRTFIGRCYLDVGLVPSSPILLISILVMLIGLAGFLLTVGMKLSLTVNQKKAEKAGQIDYADVLRQMDGAYVNKISKTMLCEDYIIGSGGLGVYGVVRKEEIIWAFSKVGRVNLTAATNNIYVRLADGSYAVCASCPCRGEKNEAAFEEVKEIIFNALPDVLIGYTKDNMLAAEKRITERKS